MSRSRYGMLLVWLPLPLPGVFSFVTAGQPKFRSMWERYCNGVDAIV